MTNNQSKHAEGPGVDMGNSAVAELEDADHIGSAVADLRGGGGGESLLGMLLAGRGRESLQRRLGAVHSLDELDRVSAAGLQIVDAMQQSALPHSLRIARRVSAALTRLENASSASEVQRAVPGELGAAGAFDRVLVSAIEGSTWSPQSWWARDAARPQDRAIVESLKGSTMALSGGMVEGEIVRRRTAALVRDTHADLRTWAPFADVAEAHSYIVAPVVTSDLVVGLLHVDAGISGRELGTPDLAVVSQFADGLGLLLERLALGDRLELQRVQIREALAAAAEAVSTSAAGPVLLRAQTTGRSSVRAPAALSLARADPTQGKLTAREREVFQLLVSGATNAQIADRLTVSETTVKSHVKHILRKTRVANRAQVIAQYLQAEGRGGRA